MKALQSLYIRKCYRIKAIQNQSALRIKLVKRFVKQFGTDWIAGILGDREFIGKDWLRWLDKNGIRFLVRIKANQIITNARGLEVDVSALFYGVTTHEVKNICGKLKFSGMEVYLSGTRDKNGELLVVVSNIGDAE